MPPADLISSRAAALSQADFLRMLTEQLKAQDPLNPLSGQEFASQLAQFSSLQELQGMGTTLDDQLQADLLLTQTFNNTMAATLIGKVVRAEQNQIEMEATGEQTLTYDLPTAATEISVNITDSSGKVVRTLTLSPQEAGEHTVTWDGLNSDGVHVPAGTYTYSISAKDADGNAVTATTYLEGRVTEVRYSNGSAVLIVNGREISLGSVLSVRDPSDAEKG
jgi:flagellar basal-body rod modification protein FlgD